VKQAPDIKARGNEPVAHSIERLFAGREVGVDLLCAPMLSILG
jgi:hypothetical protein